MKKKSVAFFHFKQNGHLGFESLDLVENFEVEGVESVENPET